MIVKILNLIFIFLLIRFIWTNWIRPLFVDEAEERRQRQIRQQQQARLARQRYMSILMTLIARIAKIDGRVSDAEIAFVEQLFREYELDSEERQYAKAAFSRAKDDPHAFEEALVQFNLSRYSFEVRFVTFQQLLSIARIDGGTISPAQRDLLWHAGTVFGIPRTLIEHLLGRTGASSYSYSYQQHSQRQQRTSSRSQTSSREEDLALLGLKPNATAAEMKRAYRQKVKELHPDRLQAQGLPVSMIKDATNRMAAINAAYDRLTR